MNFARLVLSLSFAFFVAFSLQISTIGCGNSLSQTQTGTSTGTGSGTSSNTGTDTGDTGGGGVNPGDAVPLDLTAGTDWDATVSWIDAKANEVATSWAEGIWKATEGQMYLRSLVMTNQDLGARILFRGGPDAVSLPDYPGAVGTTSIGGIWQMELIGPAFRQIFLHEFGHAQWVHSQEEYNCTNCVMQGASYTNAMLAQYCDSENCLSYFQEYGGCWGRYILNRYPTWTHTGKDPGPAPTCELTVNH